MKPRDSFGSVVAGDGRGDTGHMIRVWPPSLVNLVSMSFQREGLGSGDRVGVDDVHHGRFCRKSVRSVVRLHSDQITVQPWRVSAALRRTRRSASEIGMGRSGRGWVPTAFRARRSHCRHWAGVIAESWIVTDRAPSHESTYTASAGAISRRSWRSTRMASFKQRRCFMVAARRSAAWGFAAPMSAAGALTGSTSDA